MKTFPQIISKGTEVWLEFCLNLSFRFKGENSLQTFSCVTVLYYSEKI